MPESGATSTEQEDAVVTFTKRGDRESERGGLIIGCNFFAVAVARVRVGRVVMDTIHCVTGANAYAE